MSTSKKPNHQHSNVASSIRTDYFTRNKPISFFTEKRSGPFASPMPKPSSAYKSHKNRKQQAVPGRPDSLNKGRQSLHSTATTAKKTNEDERVRTLIDFFGDADVLLNKGQTAFALHCLGYVSKPISSGMDTSETRTVDIIFEQLRDKLTNKVSLDSIVKFFSTLEALQDANLSMKRGGDNNKTIWTDNYASPQKENFKPIVNSGISFSYLQTKEQMKLVTTTEPSTIARFSFGSENKNTFNTFNKPKMSTPNSFEKSVAFVATVDLEGCKKQIKVFKGDSLRLVAKKFTDDNQLSEKQYNKLYKCLVKRFEKVVDVQQKGYRDGRA